MLHTLSDDDPGQFLVTTATGSQYLLDLTARTARRQLAVTAPIPEALDAGQSQLRRDGETLDLLKIELCRVGTAALF